MPDSLCRITAVGEVVRPGCLNLSDVPTAVQAQLRSAQRTQQRMWALPLRVTPDLKRSHEGPLTPGQQGMSCRIQASCI